MLECNRSDISQVIDVNKNKNISRECSLCKFCYFLDTNFKYGPYLCDGCYDMSIKVNSMQNLTIVYHGENAYRIIFVFMSKKDAFNLIKNAVIIDKKETL